MCVQACALRLFNSSSSFFTVQQTIHGTTFTKMFISIHLSTSTLSSRCQFSLSIAANEIQISFIFQIFKFSLTLEMCGEELKWFTQYKKWFMAQEWLTLEKIDLKKTDVHLPLFVDSLTVQIAIGHVISIPNSTVYTANKYILRCVVT